MAIDLDAQTKGLVSQRQAAAARYATVGSLTPGSPYVAGSARRNSRGAFQNITDPTEPNINRVREAELEIGMPLWLPGQRGALRDTVTSSVNEFSQRLDLRRLEVAGRIRDAWWQAQRTAREAAIARERLETAKEIERDIGRQAQLGDVAPPDGLLARNETLAAQTELIQAEAAALALGRPIWALGTVGLLVIAPLLWLERWIHGLLAPGRDANGSPSDDDLRLLVESVEDARKLEEDEREMIGGIFGMSVRPVREVMVPRIDVVSQPREATLGEILDQVVATGYSRIPIVNDSIDDVVGLIYAKDVLRALRAGALEDPAEPIARAAYFVPDTKKVDELLQDLQQKRVHMAIVVDEYGGTAGIVTIEDLLEEIVGEIRDEYDVNEELPIQQIDEREAVVDARVSIRDLNEALDVHLDVEELDTLGGLVYHELGKLPTEGDEVRVNGCLVTVLSTQGRRIKKLRVRVVDHDVEEG